MTNIHQRSRALHDISGLVAWINRTSGTKIKSCQDQSEVITFFHVTDPAIIVSTIPKDGKESPELVESPTLNLDSEEYVHIIKAFRSGVYFQSKNPGGTRSKTISTKTKGFSEPELKKIVDGLCECSIKTTVLAEVRI